MKTLRVPRRKPELLSDRHWDKIVFAHPCRNGDIHCSRGLVRFCLEHFLCDRVEYHHRNSSRLLQDLPVAHIRREVSESVSTLAVDGNTIFMCPWYAKHPEFDRTVSINYDCLWGLFSTFLEEGFGVAPKPWMKTEMFPEINFKHYDIEPIAELMRGTNFDNNVYWANSKPLSGHSLVDLDDHLDEVANQFPGKTFFVTNPTTVRNNNIVVLGDYFKHLDNDMNECAYAATFCRVLIGQSSGPHTFSYIKQIYSDPRRHVLTLTSRGSLGHWAPVDEYACRQHYTTDRGKAREFITGVLRCAS